MKTSKLLALPLTITALTLITACGGNSTNVDSYQPSDKPESQLTDYLVNKAFPALKNEAIYKIVLREKQMDNNKSAEDIKAKDSFIPCIEKLNVAYTAKGVEEALANELSEDEIKQVLDFYNSADIMAITNHFPEEFTKLDELKISDDTRKKIDEFNQSDLFQKFNIAYKMTGKLNPDDEFQKCEIYTQGILKWLPNERFD